MSKIKYADMLGIKNCVDNPRLKSATDVKNGYAIVTSISSDGSEVASIPTNVTDAKKVEYFVCNDIDKPELQNESDFVIKSGEFIRGIKFNKDYLVNISADLINTTATLTDGTTVLVPATASGLWTVATTSDSGYATALKVTKQIKFGNGVGYEAKVVTI